MWMCNRKCFACACRSAKWSYKFPTINRNGLSIDSACDLHICALHIRSYIGTSKTNDGMEFNEKNLHTAIVIHWESCWTKWHIKSNAYDRLIATLNIQRNKIFRYWWVGFELYSLGQSNRRILWFVWRSAFVARYSEWPLVGCFRVSIEMRSKM